jgi:hypothetical protein
MKILPHLWRSITLAGWTGQSTLFDAHPFFLPDHDQKLCRDLLAHPTERIGGIEGSMAEKGMDRAGTETTFSIRCAPETGRILAER